MSALVRMACLLLTTMFDPCIAFRKIVGYGTHFHRCFMAAAAQFLQCYLVASMCAAGATASCLFAQSSASTLAASSSQSGQKSHQCRQADVMLHALWLARQRCLCLVGRMHHIAQAPALLLMQGLEVGPPCSRRLLWVAGGPQAPWWQANPISVAGMEGSLGLGSVERFVEEDQRWEPLPSLLQARCGAACSVLTCRDLSMW